MCSIVLHITADGVFIAANRDEMVNRLWDPPEEYWPGISGGRDQTGGGTWAALNRNNIFAALLNRTGTLGPATGKTSRGNLPLLALAHKNAAEAASSISELDATKYRSFNLVIADAKGAFLLRGLEHGTPDSRALAQGVTMITSGEANDLSYPRIARHLPRFKATRPENWMALLADSSGSREEQLNITPPSAGFGTVCSTFIHLPRNGGATHLFAQGTPDQTPFLPVTFS
ncbi:MAG: NRDE family protein [Rhodospirillales bacterium]|nr:NRDE family protein [Rhodospirillales bacterium]